MDLGSLSLFVFVLALINLLLLLCFLLFGKFDFLKREPKRIDTLVPDEELEDYLMRKLREKEKQNQIILSTTEFRGWIRDFEGKNSG